MGGRMNIHKTHIFGVMSVETTPFIDQRGSFSRWFCDDELSSIIDGRRIVQVNHSCTREVGAVRGLHYQNSPYAEMKFVRCIRGRVWDVAVDVRADSPTYLQWHAEELSAENQRMLVIPEGCAHGFQVLEESSEMLYLHTEFYLRDSEGGLQYSDPDLGITWPLKPTDVSERDRNHSFISEGFQGVVL